MTKEISLSLLVKTLKSAWWKILIVAIVVAIAVAAFTEFVIPKKYVSNVEFYVINSQMGVEYTQTALLSASERLATDYIKVIQGDTVVEMIRNMLKEKHGVELSDGSIRSMMSSQIATSSSTFTMSVTANSPEMAYDIANLLETRAPAVIRKETRDTSDTKYYVRKVTGYDTNNDAVYEYVPVTAADLECVSIIRSAKLPASHSAPSVMMYSFVAAVVSAMAVYAIVLIKKISDTTIRSEENVKDILDPSVIIIGKIPKWFDDSKKAQGGKTK